jgi:hypothetical protein
MTSFKISPVSNFIIVLLFLFTGNILAQNKHNDLLEFGLNGPVKSVITVKYDTTGFDTSGKIRKGAEWKFKNEYYFNKSSNLDSIAWTMRYDEDQNPYFRKRLFHYNNGVRTAVDKDTLGILTDSLLYTWNNDTSYTITQKEVGNNSINISQHSLSRLYRDHCSTTVIYENDSIVLREYYENTVDKNNRTIATNTFNELTGERTSITYEHFELDRRGNTTRIIQRDGDTGKITLIMIREIEYY